MQEAESKKIVPFKEHAKFKCDITVCKGADKSSVTHKNGKKDKSSISLDWRPGSGDSFYFNFTVVKDYATYWVKSESELLKL